MERPIVKRYSNGEVTVVWKPDVCIHSTVCFRGLPEVFDPRKRPWVTIAGATTERIVAQVRQCPSGALSYEMNREGVQAVPDPDAPANEAAYEPTEVRIEVVPNGPLRIHGSLAVQDPRREGEVVRKGPAASFCRCGHSANKPFCDGSHKRVGFQD